MKPFGREEKAWGPPDPDCLFAVGCSASELPPIFAVAHPEGQGGALLGYPILEADESEKGDNRELERPMRSVETFFVAAPERGLWRVEVLEPGSVPRLPRDLWHPPNPSPEMEARITSPRFEVVIDLVETDATLGPVVLYGTELADRVAALAEGATQDPEAFRVFGPGEWRVSQPSGDVDPREHVIIHSVLGETEAGAWIHTHGLTKFGRPELEVYDVPDDLVEPWGWETNNLVAYLIGGELIEPGHTLGDPNMPLYARPGGRDREHWEETQVLELVDVRDDGEPFDRGAERGLRAWLDFDPEA